LPITRNGQALSEAEGNGYRDKIATPACVKACPADCLRFGTREDMLEEAHSRISNHPDKYIDHIYGEKEAGGTSVLYLSSVSFDKLGFPDVGDKPFPAFSKMALQAVPPAVMVVGSLLAGAYALFKRRLSLVGAESGSSLGSAGDIHVDFEPLQYKLLTPFSSLMLLLMAFGVVSLIARFVLGLGGGTHLSDTYAWGLWIVFDLVWIAIAAGAFATAGIIYVFQRKDLYSMGRSAVLMGL
jgi:formate dehydrogenase iron-sulfur subunit